MRHLFAWVVALCLAAAPSYATTYFVNSATGSDSNNGTSSGSPFATICHADNAGLVNPGDVINVAVGNGYTGECDLSRSGSSSGVITYQWQTTGQRPVIHNGAVYQAINIAHASYITINGFDFEGNIPNTTLANCQSNGTTAACSDAGITVGTAGNIPSYIPVHITIENCISAFHGEGGFVIIAADYISILNNIVHDNSNYSSFGGSGISVGYSRNSDASTGVKIIVSGNQSYNNKELVLETNCGNRICDGEGIILDDWSNDQTDNTVYTGSALVENNLTYNNGSNGILVFDSGPSAHFQILYNTTYKNATGSVNNQEINVLQGSNVTIENNIMYAGGSGLQTEGSTTSTNILYDYNVIFNGTACCTGPHDISGDPQFVNAGAANFTIPLTSPAINTANTAFTVATDISGNPRPSNGGYDIGAFQTVAVPPANPVPVPAPLTGTVTLNNWVAFDQSFSGIKLACGKPFHFIVAKPPQYNGTSFKYPLYIWLHPTYEGDPWYYGGNTNPLFLSGDEGGSYNTVPWMTQFPAFYVLPYADQTNGNGTSGSCTGDGNDAVQNWGGWFSNGATGSGTVYSGNTGPNVFALLDMITFLESQFTIDTSRIYINGFSLGAIGAGYLCQHYNIINGSPAVFAACLESGGGVDEADAPVTNLTEATMQNVPTWYFSGATDTASPPGDYNTPLCNGLGGNSSALNAITSATANRCGTSQMRYTLCPTCGHQDTDASGNPVWTNQAMSTFAFAQGGGGGVNPATAQRSGDFLNMLAVQGGISGGGAPYIASAQQVADLQYLGITHYRDGLNIALTGSTGSIPIGFYGGQVGQGASGSYPGFDVQWDGFVSVMGRSPTLMLTYMDQTEGAPNNTTFDWTGQGGYFSGLMKGDTRTVNVIPVIGVPFGSSVGGNFFAGLAAGTYDSEIQGLLGAWKANGFTTLELRPAWEFNLNGNYGVTTANLSMFLAAWQHFYTVAHTYAAANGLTIKIVWNPNVGPNQVPGGTTLTVAQQYPGNAFVDVLGIDTYGAPIGSVQANATTTDPTQYYVQTMFNMALAGGKTVAFGEVGGIDQTFATNMVNALSNAAIRQGVSIEFFDFWDVDDPDSGNLSWTNASDNQSTLAAIWVGGFGPSGSVTAGVPTNPALQALANGGITMDAQVPYGTISPAAQIATLQQWQALGGQNFVYSIEGINEPGIGTITYNGQTGGEGGTWVPVSDYMIDYYTAVKATPSLASLPFFGVSRVGQESNNAGLQFIQVPTPTPSGVLIPGGSVLTQYFTQHVYPMFQSSFHSPGVANACQTNDPTAGNAFNIELHWNAVSTWVGGFAGYASDALAQAIPRVETEFGYATIPAPSANGASVTEDKKGRCLLTGFMTGWQLGLKMMSVYNLYDLSGQGFGLMAGSGSPNLSGTYVHDFTTVLADTGATARTFTPGSLTYALTGLPSSGGQQLLQTSNGHYKLILWNNATDWNIAAGTPITVPAASVAVNLSGGTNFTMQVFDPVQGINSIQTITSGNAITVSVADYPIVVDIVPANSATEVITVNAVATQAATVPFVVSGSIANSSIVPTLQYSVNGGPYQALPASSGTRNPYNQPGSNNSVWNTPFGSGATWSNASAPAICTVAGNTTTGCYGNINVTGNFGRTEYTSTSLSDGTYTFSASTNGRTIAPDNGSTLTATMHVPTGAITPGPYSSGCDCSFILQDSNSFPNRQYTWGGITPTGVAPPGLQPGQGPFNAGEGGEWDDITSDTYGQDYDTGLSGFNVGDGLINACDVNPSCNPNYPQIKHALRYSLDPKQFKSNSVPGQANVLNPSGWPDRLEDTQSGLDIYSGTVLFGSTLGIPPSVAAPAGLDANCMGLLWTMQHYPLIPRDTGGGGFNLTVDQIADTSAWATSARSCLPTLVGLLQILTNQHQGGQSFTTQPANGPGARVDVGPLPLSGGTANVTQTSFSFTVPGQAANSSNTVSVRDANTPSVVGTSNTFIVSGGSGTLSGTTASVLPSGYLKVVGNQIQDGNGNNVRLACVGYNIPSGNGFPSDLAKMRSEGFNCARYPFYEGIICPGGVCNFTTTDSLASAALASNMKLIFDHHGNEVDCGGQQANGLWYDVNSTTPVAGVTWNALSNNTDGCGNTGTVTYARFKANWTAIAQHYAGNTTLIGFDLDNEPFIGGNFQTTLVNWGGNNGADEHLMCQDTGSAIEAADPGVLVICEGPINFTGPFLSGAAFPSGGRNIQDLSKAQTVPIVLTGDVGSHVVYSVHDYPQDISGQTPDSGSAAVAFRNTGWGFLETSGFAPVWIGEMGASLDGTTGNLSDEQGWATMIQAYVNGQDGALGGPTFTGCQQPLGTDWFAFGNLAGDQLDGTLNADGSNRAAQFAVWSTFLYTTCSQNNGGGGNGGGGVGATTWNPSDKSAGITLSNGNLTASDTETVDSDTVRSTTSVSTGKTYFEVTATTSSTDWAVGLSNSSFNLTLHAGLGGDGNGIGFYNVSPTQAIYYNAAQLTVGSSAGTTGDTIYVAADIPNHLLWISSPVMRAASTPWNNSGSANPATGAGGLSFAGLTCPCFITFNTEETPSAATLNAGGPFTGTVPSGFSAWQAPITSGNHPILINLGN